MLVGMVIHKTKRIGNMISFGFKLNLKTLKTDSLPLTDAIQKAAEEAFSQEAENLLAKLWKYSKNTAPTTRWEE